MATNLTGLKISVHVRTQYIKPDPFFTFCMQSLYMLHGSHDDNLSIYFLNVENRLFEDSLLGNLFSAKYIFM